MLLKYKKKKFDKIAGKKKSISEYSAFIFMIITFLIKVMIIIIMISELCYVEVLGHYNFLTFLAYQIPQIYI